MLYPELSLPDRPLRERFLDLAATICRQEIGSLKLIRTTGFVYRWTPKSMDPFPEPISLRRVEVTKSPFVTDKFSVIEGEFEILGDEGMEVKVSSSMREADFPNDEWNQYVFDKISTSFENHTHSVCESYVALELAEFDRQSAAARTALQESEPGYTFTDKRGSR